MPHLETTGVHQGPAQVRLVDYVRLLTPLNVDVLQCIMHRGLLVGLICILFFCLCLIRFYDTSDLTNSPSLWPCHLVGSRAPVWVLSGVYRYPGIQNTLDDTPEHMFSLKRRFGHRKSPDTNPHHATHGPPRVTIRHARPHSRPSLGTPFLAVASQTCPITTERILVPSITSKI